MQSPLSWLSRWMKRGKRQAPRRANRRRPMLEVLEDRLAPVVSFAPATNFAIESGPFSVTVEDFNGDGKTDLATANGNTNNVSVLLGNGLGGFGAATNFAVGSTPLSVTVGDFNGDGKADLAIANSFSNNVSVLLGNGLGGFAAATTFAVGSEPASVTVRDFNGDGKVDLATANRVSNNVSVLLGNGLGGFGAATHFAVGTFPNSVTVGDFNGDGKADLATSNPRSNNVSVLLGNGNGTFTAATNFAVGVSPSSVKVGDFNRDGKADLAAANSNSNNVSVLLGNGNGTFAAATNFAVGASPFPVTVGDFDGDGNVDLAAANTDFASNGGSTVSVLLGNGLGGFGAATNFAVGASPYSLVVGDFNGDGKADLATANFNSRNVSVLLNVPANAPPVVAANVAAVSANEGGTVTNTGTFSDAQGNNTVTITATVGGVAFGTVTKNDANGTWNWSANAADGPAGPFTVTIRATDTQNAAANATFTYAVNNVVPTISLSGNAEVNEGAPYTLNLGVVTDPGLDTITSYKINWGDGAIDSFTGSPANTTAYHTYADGPTNQTHTVTVTDEDGINVLAGSLSVIVKNADPTATFAGNGPTTYGETVTVSFSDQHDDSSADTTAGFHYAYSDTGDFTGITYASGSSTLDSHDYTGLGAGDYTFYARIIDKDGGFTQYSFNVTVNKASSTTTTIGAGPFTYDGSAHAGGSGTVTGAGGLATGVTSLTYSANSDGSGVADLINAGTYYVTAHYTGDANHEASDGAAVAITIAKASISYTIGDAAHVYGSTVDLASALGATIDTGVNGENLAIAYSSAGNTATANAGAYHITGIVSDGTGLASNYEVTLTPGALTVTQATLTGDATTQDAINMAKQGKLTITISNVAGLVNGDTLLTFLSTAEYYITVGANQYVFVPTTVTTSGDSITIAYTLKNSDLASQLAAELEDNTSEATAVSAGFTMESTNYTFTDEYLTRLFSTVK